MAEYLPLLLFVVVCLVLLLGYPVAFSLGGTALAFAWIGGMSGHFDDAFLLALPNRLYGSIMTNEILVAVPLFVFMGVMLERSRVAENLLDTMASLFGSLRGGLGISVVFVGALLAATTGIVGATVVAMGLISLPAMLRNNYSHPLATGTGPNSWAMVTSRSSAILERCSMMPMKTNSGMAMSVSRSTSQ